MNQHERYFHLMLQSAARLLESNERQGSPLGDYGEVNALHIAVDWFEDGSHLREVMRIFAEREGDE